jgi:hypothetical protein
VVNGEVGSLLDKELVLDVVKIFAGAGAEFVSRGEVETGGHEEIRDFFHDHVAGPREMVASGAGYLERDGIVGMGPDG